MAMKMNRRTFLKTTAAAAVAVSMTGLLGGCGDSLASNELQLGLYRVSVYDLDVDNGTEMSGSTGSILGKATLLFAGDGSQSESYNGMFKARVGNETLNTVEPTGKLISSGTNIPLIGKPWSKTDVDLKMNFKTAETRNAYQNGAVAELTVTVSGVSGILYLVKRNGRYVALNQRPAGV